MKTRSLQNEESRTTMTIAGHTIAIIKIITTTKIPVTERGIS